MEQTYPDLGRRIVQAARMAVAMHLEFFPRTSPSRPTDESGLRRSQQRDGVHGSNASGFTDEALMVAARPGRAPLCGADRGNLADRSERSEGGAE